MQLRPSLLCSEVNVGVDDVGARPEYPVDTDVYGHLLLLLISPSIHTLLVQVLKK